MAAASRDTVIAVVLASLISPRGRPVAKLTCPLVLVLSSLMSLMDPLALPPPPASLTLLNCDCDAHSPVDAATEYMTERLGPRMLAGLDAIALARRLVGIGTSTMRRRGGAMIALRRLPRRGLEPLARALRGKADAEPVLRKSGIGCNSAAAARRLLRRASLAPPSGGEFGASSPTRALRRWRVPCNRATLAPCQ